MSRFSDGSLLQKTRRRETMSLQAAGPRGGAGFLHSPLIQHTGRDGHCCIQEACLPPICEVWATLQRRYGLAQMPPIILPAEIHSDVPQRLQIEAKSCAQNLTRSSGPWGTNSLHGLTYLFNCSVLWVFHHIISTCMHGCSNNYKIHSNKHQLK